MRNFTPEEKELIVNTPITVDSFEFNKHLPMPYSYINDESETELDNVYYHIAWSCEHLRQNFLETKDPEFEEQLLRLLPNSYKVVNLCAEQKKKDFCKYKHKVLGKKVSVSSIGTTSDAFPCYEVYSCDKCDCFKM
jgi:hypothetical protein